MNLFDGGLIFGLLLAFNDLITMSISKEIIIGNLTSNWLVITFILYGFQMMIFYTGLKSTPMSLLNLSWNLISNIIITIIGIYYFKENISNLETYGLLFGLFSLFLFGIAHYNKL